MPLFAQFTVYDYAEQNSGGKISFKIQNTTSSAIDVTGYQILIFTNGSVYPSEIHQQPQSGTSGLSFDTSKDCGGNNYIFTGTAVSGVSVPSSMCWFGSTSHCTQSLEFWFGQNGEIPLTHNGIAVINNLGNIVAGSIPTGFETCAVISSSSSSSVTSSSSSSPLVCTESITVYDTTYIPVPIDSFYNVGVPVDSIYKIPVPVDSFYNVGIPVDSIYKVPVPIDSFYNVAVPVDSTYKVAVAVDSFYSVPVPFDSLVPVFIHDTISDTTWNSVYVTDTIRDTTWITLSMEKEAEFNLSIIGNTIETISIHQPSLITSPILTVDINMTELHDDDIVKLEYVAYVYDVIGQYVDDTKGEEILTVVNGMIVKSYSYNLLSVDVDGNIVNKKGRKYGNGAYVIRADIRIYVNNKSVTNDQIKKTMGLMRNH